MKLIQCRFSSGQRVPLLVQTGDATPLPMLVPFIYVQLKLRCGRQANNLVARIGTAATAPFPQIDPRTRDQYLRLLKLYLSWCVTRYIPRARLTSSSRANIEVVFSDVADVVERRFESHILNVRPDRTHYRSLTDTQLEIIRTLIRPGTAENPIPERLQLRNWLMIELLLETGIRRGELLKLYTTDVNEGSQHAYVSINDREHDPSDPRAEEPALKAHGRTVGISAQLYEVYELYIQSERRPLRNGKLMRLP